MHVKCIVSVEHPVTVLAGILGAQVFILVLSCPGPSDSDHAELAVGPLSLKVLGAVLPHFKALHDLATRLRRTGHFLVRVELR